MTVKVVSEKTDRQALTLRNVDFLDEDGLSYDPTTVEKRVSTDNGATEITAWTSLLPWTGPQDVPVTAAEMAIQTATRNLEKHVVEVVGDRGTDDENPLSIVIPIRNRVRLTDTA